MVLNTSDREWPGRWSLASEPDEEVSGILHLTPALAMKLELLGDFKSAPEFIHKPIVGHGVTVRGDEVTIELTDLAGTGLSGFGTRKSYTVGRVIRGAQLQTLDPVVSSVKVGLSCLHDWLQPSAFAASSTFAEFPYGAKHTIEYQEPDPIRLLDGPEFSLHAVFSGGLPFSNPRAKSNALHSYTSLRLDRATPAPLSVFLTLVGRLRALFSFATASHNAVTYLEAYPARDESRPFRNQLDPKGLLDFYPVDEPEESERSLLHPFQMLFDLADEQRLAQRTFEAWLDRWAELGPLIHLFLSATQTQHAYQEQAFLALVQALEGLHRIICPNELVPRAEHRAQVRRILSSVSTEDCPLVRRALQYSNEPSLRHRIEDLLQRGLQVVPQFMANGDLFLKRVVNTRHYFSHFAPGLRPRAASSLELFSMVQVLSTLFEILLLLELGWPEEGVREVVQRSQHNRPNRGIVRFVLEDRWGRA